MGRSSLSFGRGRERGVAAQSFVSNNAFEEKKSASESLARGRPEKKASLKKTAARGRRGGGHGFVRPAGLPASVSAVGPVSFFLYSTPRGFVFFFSDLFTR